MTSIPSTTTMLSPHEARALTDQIRHTAETLWSLLLESSERRAWEALGYSSWRKYAEVEFNMSQSYAYRLLHQANVIVAVADAAGISPRGEIVTERVAREIRSADIELVATDVRDRIEQGDAPNVAVASAIHHVARTLPRNERAVASDESRQVLSNRILANIVEQAQKIVRNLDQIDYGRIDSNYTCLDSTHVKKWTRELRHAIQTLTYFAGSLEHARSNVTAEIAKKKRNAA